MVTYTGKSGKHYTTVDQPLAGGGEGNIFDITGSSNLVAKIYKPDKRTTETERKLLSMANIKPSVIEQYAWTLDVLYENGAFAGFIMHKVIDKEKLRNIYVYDNRIGKPWAIYITIARNIAAAVFNVHEVNQVIGDLNPENIMANPQTGLVTLVDIDSYHITDQNGRVYRCGVGMPEFVAPELQGKHFPSDPLPTFTKETDEFALSVLLFALLMNGAHPFACKTLSGSASKFQPIDNLERGICAYFEESRQQGIDIPKYAPDIKMLPLDIQGLFYRAFVSGHKVPSMRPRADEWYYALERLEKNIKKCTKKPEHLYYAFFNECPWCTVEYKMQGRIVVSDKQVIADLIQDKQNKDNEIARLNQNIDSLNKENNKISGERNDAVNAVNSKNKWLMWSIMTGIIAIIISICVGYGNSNLNSKYNTLIAEHEKLIAGVVTVTSLTVGNWGNGNWITQPGGTLNAKDIRFLTPMITYNALMDGEVTVYVKIIRPNGTIYRNIEKSPVGYSYSTVVSIKSGKWNSVTLSGWGNESGGSYKAGQYTIELWYNGVCLRSEKVLLN